MKKNGTSGSTLPFLVISALLFVLNLPRNAAEGSAAAQVASANTGFAFSLLQQLALEQPGSNIFVSPYSASTVLQMVSTGAGGTTLSEMEQALGTTNLPLATLERGNLEMGSLINARNPNVILSAANAVWYRAGLPVEAAFLSSDRRFFDAKVEALSFTSPESPKIINSWASKETRGMITNVVQALMGPRTQMLLANAVYFFGNWQTKFQTNLTTKEPFNLTGGGHETVSMMHQTGTFDYTAGADFQAVRLPYHGNSVAMYIFLPAAGSSVENLLTEMNAQWWQQALTNALTPQQGTVGLPRFDLDYSVSLIPALQALGMESAFTYAADFSKISSKHLYISAVQQQTVVKVNEKGTEAAAVTTVTAFQTAGVIGFSPFEMIVNRPFLFFIQDTPAKTILFAGAVLAP